MMPDQPGIKGKLEPVKEDELRCIVAWASKTQGNGKICRNRARMLDMALSNSAAPLAEIWHRHSPDRAKGVPGPGTRCPYEWLVSATAHISKDGQGSGPGLAELLLALMLRAAQDGMFDPKSGLRALVGSDLVSLQNMCTAAKLERGGAETLLEVLPESSITTGLAWWVIEEAQSGSSRSGWPEKCLACLARRASVGDKFAPACKEKDWWPKWPRTWIAALGLCAEAQGAVELHGFLSRCDKLEMKDLACLMQEASRHDLAVGCIEGGYTLLDGVTGEISGCVSSTWAQSKDRPETETWAIMALESVLCGVAGSFERHSDMPARVLAFHLGGWLTHNSSNDWSSKDAKDAWECEEARFLFDKFGDAYLGKRLDTSSRGDVLDSYIAGCRHGLTTWEDSFGDEGNPPVMTDSALRPLECLMKLDYYGHFASIFVDKFVHDCSIPAEELKELHDNGEEMWGGRHVEILADVVLGVTTDWKRPTTYRGLKMDHDVSLPLPKLGPQPSRGHAGQ